MLFNVHDKLAKDLALEDDIDQSESGSTLISIIMKDDRLFCVNTGDSRAILVCFDKKWSVKNISRDHRPEDADEVVRIKSHGGRVARAKDSNNKDVGPLRI
mmetsp:Transcript_115169/g.247552  ORF Transcript_115169/g.247552 Transcript_115169/m.247552 type:complete len:101 (+) Transcript_115169:388-690(+)